MYENKTEGRQRAIALAKEIVERNRAKSLGFESREAYLDNAAKEWSELARQQRIVSIEMKRLLSNIIQKDVKGHRREEGIREELRLISDDTGVYNPAIRQHPAYVIFHDMWYEKGYNADLHLSFPHNTPEEYIRKELQREWAHSKRIVWDNKDEYLKRLEEWKQRSEFYEDDYTWA